ncbi:MAG: YraN family protein [Actinomycetia bacterium]|nr:YraN family protein [Actinomycetes bacterium]
MDRLWNNKKIGTLGEAVAESYLKEKGYQILQKNYSVVTGEIDIIAEKDDTVVFVEVKTRTTQQYGRPEESINNVKVNRIRKVAQYFLKRYDYTQDHDIRFDIVSILADRKRLERLSGKEHDTRRLVSISDHYCTIEHIADAF